MGESTGIAWTDATWNVWRGCTKVSAGCANCYAERGSRRNPRVLGTWGPRGTRVLASETAWGDPERWDRAAGLGRPRLVFCASLADVFEDWPGQLTDARERPLWRFPDTPPQGSPFNLGPEHNAGAVPYSLDDARARLWALIRRTPNLRWQLLTKRPENVSRMMPPGDWPNVWLGVSVESQAEAWRLDALAEARASVRCPVGFVSAEPLLGPLSLWGALGGVEWLIAGGESGAAAREMRLAWLRSLLAQCRDALVPAFVKQLGRCPVMPGVGGGLPLPMTHDAGHGGDLRDWPVDLRVQQWPAGR